MSSKVQFDRIYNIDTDSILYADDLQNRRFSLIK